MSSDEDDEALTWAGGRDPSHYESPEPIAAKPPRTPRRGSVAPVEADAVEPTGVGADQHQTADEADLPPVTSAAMLVSLGVLVGVYGLYTIGWIISLQRLLYASTNTLDEAAFRTQQLLGIAGPVIWFVGAFILTRRSRPHVRLLWLLAGAVLLVPWSFVFGI